MFEAYNIIFEALLDKGYTEQEAEELICQVIVDQKDMDDIASNIHKIIKANKLVS